MNKVKHTLVAFLLMTSASVFSQDLSKFNLYHPNENAKEEIAKSVKQAKASGKHVFIQIGGNWCIWCARFNDFVTKFIDQSQLCGIPSQLQQREQE
jgi:hypothetical protein